MQDEETGLVHDNMNSSGSKQSPPTMPKKTASPARTAALTSNNNNSNGMTDNQLRQRRRQIVNSKNKEEQEIEVMKRTLRDSTQTAKAQQTRLYVIIGVASILSLFTVMGYVRPRRLFGRTGKQSKPISVYLGTLFPENVIMERDLPRFFLSYSIATPENKPARVAQTRLLHSKKHLQEPGFRVRLPSYDDAQIQRLMARNLCGAEFKPTYDRETDFGRKQDLVLWCLQATQLVDGFFWNEIDFVESAFALARGRGIVALSGEAQLATNFFVRPRLNETTNDLPIKMFAWVMGNEISHFETPQEYRYHLSRFFYDLVAYEGLDRYLVLDTEEYESEDATSTTKGSDSISPKFDRAIARHCPSPKTCVEYVVPLHEGGRFDREEETAEQENDGH